MKAAYHGDETARDDMRAAGTPLDSVAATQLDMSDDLELQVRTV